MKSIDVAVWGSTGYAGEELMGILWGHPNVGMIATPGRDMPDDLEGIDTAFLALPAGESAKVASQLRKAGRTVVDLSGDFRFPTAEEYEQWYHQPHPAPELLPAPYALPEINRDKIPHSKLLSVPGCYPTATLLGVIPLIDRGLIKPFTTIEINALSGVSGMGKAKKEEADEIIASGEVRPYKTGRQHQHVGEMEQFLRGSRVDFTPSVGPFFRGMIVTTTPEFIYGVSPQHVNSTLQEAYADEPFVEVLDDGVRPNRIDTENTDICQIGTVVMNGTLNVVSSLDNLRKGAASQAVQSFNILHEFPETTGLKPVKR